MYGQKDGAAAACGVQRNLALGYTRGVRRRRPVFSHNIRVFSSKGVCGDNKTPTFELLSNTHGPVLRVSTYAARAVKQCSVVTTRVYSIPEYINNKYE